MENFKKPIASQQIEKHCIAGLLKHPDVISEVDQLILPKIFYFIPHEIIYKIIKELFYSGYEIDNIIVSEKVKNLGISFKKNLNIFEYLDSLNVIPITKKATVESFEELLKLKIRRDLYNETKKIANYLLSEAGNRSVDEIISECDKIYYDRILTYKGTKNEPEDLFKGLIEMIDDRANNPIREVGLITPYEEFNNLYGGLTGGDIYAFVSRPKHGKSTILSDIAYKVCLSNPPCRALYLDTEMKTLQMKWRIASSVLKMPVWTLQTGNFKKSESLAQKYEKSKDKLKDKISLVDHIQVGNTPINQVLSLIRRWFYKKIGRGNPCVVIYDYLKLTGESDINKKEYQLVGEKVNVLKELATELDIPILTACQANRDAERGFDDSAIIAQSDRLQWFGSYVGHFRRKTRDEINDEGDDFGTHKLICLASRFQGREAPGHMNLIQVPLGYDKKLNGTKKKRSYVWRENFINFNIEYFHVEERGTYSDIIARKEHQFNLDDNKDKERDDLL